MAHPYFPGDTLTAPLGRVSLAQAPSWPDGLPPGSSGAMPVGRIALAQASTLPGGPEWLASAKTATLVAAVEVQQQLLRIEEDARKAQLSAAEQRGALAEAERIEPHFALASSYLRDFARRLEFKP